MTFDGSPGSDMLYFVCWYCEKSPEHLRCVDSAHAMVQLIAYLHDTQQANNVLNVCVA